MGQAETDEVVVKFTQQDIGVLHKITDAALRAAGINILGDVNLIISKIAIAMKQQQEN